MELLLVFLVAGIIVWALLSAANARNKNPGDHDQ